MVYSASIRSFTASPKRIARWTGFFCITLHLCIQASSSEAFLATRVRCKVSLPLILCWAELYDYDQWPATRSAMCRVSKQKPYLFRSGSGREASGLTPVEGLYACTQELTIIQKGGHTQYFWLPESLRLGGSMRCCSDRAEASLGFTDCSMER